jgi:hypothetical protein
MLITKVKRMSHLEASGRKGQNNCDDAQPDLLSKNDIEKVFAQPEPAHERPLYKGESGFYSPEEYGWDYEEVINFPCGKYFLGDPCYAIPEAYDEEAGLIPYDAFADIKGLGRVAIFKVSGDGCYIDEEGHPHYVDSGTLGVVPIDGHSPAEWLRLKKLGRIVDFESARRPDMPYNDEDGMEIFDCAFQAMTDEQGNVFLGWNWIFCGTETPFSGNLEKANEDNTEEDRTDVSDLN